METVAIMMAAVLAAKRLIPFASRAFPSAISANPAGGVARMASVTAAMGTGVKHFP